MSDACILCDENVPRGAPHFVVDWVDSVDVATFRGSRLEHRSGARPVGPMCGDVVMCAVRVVERGMRNATWRTEHQRHLTQEIGLEVDTKLSR